MRLSNPTLIRKKKMLALAFLAGAGIFSLHAQTPYASGPTNQYLLNQPVDISEDFTNFTNTYFVADSLGTFDPSTGKGVLNYKRHVYQTRQAFNNMLAFLQPAGGNEFPEAEYEANPNMPFSIQFVSPKSFRIRMASSTIEKADEPSLMLVDGFAPEDKSSWKYAKLEDGYQYQSEFGKLIIREHPWRLEIYNVDGKLLTQTMNRKDNDETYTPLMPFSYVRRSSDYSRSFSASFRLSPREKIFGCGESFKALDKRGQKVILWTDDANGTQNETMYKPIPFFMSSRGYGMFMHTSSPITCDFGKYYNAETNLLVGDESLDLFVFLGDPKDILDEYTNLTGKPSMPPLWSFGLWMSRITYFSEADGRRVAKELRENKIPSDVIHFDTGWFETDWRCNYEFSPSRFDDPVDMIADLKDEGFRTCLWQLPYFTPKNTLFNEIIDKGLYVKNAKGNLPYEDATLDFSNPETVKWYQGKIAGLLKQGVSVIKVDFGEAAPASGIYASGKTGFYEHNLYPLRYNKAVADITKEVTGDAIIWARSTWAGSQRYPLHWGGDAANTNVAMEGTLHAGLSMGLSGFSFWSHDIGGFVLQTPKELYRRWTPFGMLTSHSRTHGAPPKEPWEYGKEFQDEFRKSVDLKYELMPYILEQAKECTEKGLPMMRALFVEYPNDPGAWLVDDQYLFGRDILVAPLFEEVAPREVYLPGGEWIDYQSRKTYSAGWHTIAPGEIPIVMLVRKGAVIPHIKLAQSTKFMDWSELELKVFGKTGENTTTEIYLPNDSERKNVQLVWDGQKYTVKNNPYRDTNFKVTVIE
ncbi:glycoside hydrolase family 31 protein [Mangrovibacterium lignilyticum]|uniref:glycoside hydrolase family 31 protein n=1 Tax=Mangrovibacterium lignilyticum TaxID=2668052 RepID=UPI001EE54EBD|nr:TIM-barrel domain-containing protein [Mangrovibacterium lignilyticum]